MRRIFFAFAALAALNACDPADTQDYRSKTEATNAAIDAAATDTGVTPADNFAATVLEVASGKVIVTADEYSALEDGMSYEEAVRIIGHPGEETASTHMDGVPGVMESITTKAYSWQNPDGSNVMLMFQNNELNTKAQFGL